MKRVLSTILAVIMLLSALPGMTLADFENIAVSTEPVAAVPAETVAPAAAEEIPAAPTEATAEIPAETAPAPAETTEPAQEEPKPAQETPAPKEETAPAQETEPAPKEEAAEKQEEPAEKKDEPAQEQEPLTDEELEHWGYEVVVSDALYYTIEDGALFCYAKDTRPEKIADGVIWVIRRGDTIYYAKSEGNNTDLYQKPLDGSSFALLTRLFCPIDAFDVSEGFVYYSYGGEVFKLDPETGTEECVQTGIVVERFYVNHSEVISVFAIKDDITDSQNKSLVLNSIDTSKYDNTEFDIYGVSWFWPTESDNLTISSEFGGWRQLTSGWDLHQGIDILGDEGLDHVYATRDGIVLDKGKSDSAGNYIMIYHGKDKTSKKCVCSTYMHMYQSAAKNIGDEVKMGEIIGVLGNTGVSTGAHVHFQVFFGKKTAFPARKGWSQENGKVYCKDFEDNYINTNPKKSFKIEEYWHPDRIHVSGENYNSNQNYCTYGSLNYTLSACEHKEYWKTGKCKSCGAMYECPKAENESKFIGVWRRNALGKTLQLYKEPYVAEEYARKNAITGNTIYVVGVVTNVNKNNVFKIRYNNETLYRWDNDVKNNYTLDTNARIPSDVALTGAKFPTGSHQKGTGFGLRGTLSSHFPIKKVTGTILRADGTKIKPEIVDDLKSGVYSYDIRYNKINNDLKFDKLAEGTYYVKYTVENEGATPQEFTSLNFDSDGDGKNDGGYFTVGSVALPPVIEIEDYRGGKRATFTQTEGLTIHYKLDNGKEKTCSSGGTLAIYTPGDHELQAWVVKNGKTVTAKQAFKLPKASAPNIWEVLKIGASIGNPVLIPILFDAGIDVEYGDDCVYVTISGEGELHYTLDGSTPTIDSPIYTSQISLKKSETVKAISVMNGHAPSDVTTKEIFVQKPEAPVIQLFHTKERIAQGKAATVSWKAVPHATSYKATLYLDGKEVESRTTDGTSASFVLSKRSDTEDYRYTIRVAAGNFKGYGKQSNEATVWGMHPVRVTVRDRIVRSGALTEEKLATVKQRVNEHDGNQAGDKLEGNVIAVQTVDYDAKPAKPLLPSKKGFDFSGWSSDLFEAATSDRTVYAEFAIKYYKVEFFDAAENLGRGALLNPQNKYFMYTDPAEPPENVSAEEGYVFAGWSLDSTNSVGTDYNYVDGDMQVDSIFRWAKPDLPIVLEITKVVRYEYSYKVSMKIKNTPDKRTTGRLIVSLYSSNGRCMQTEVHSINIAPGDYKEWADYGPVDVPCSEKISTVKAFMVGVVDNYKTGGALSKAVECTTITNETVSKTDWSSASEWQTAPVTESSTCRVQTKTQYRYRDKKYETSSSSSMSGWTQYKKERTGWGSKQGPVYSDPSNGVRKVTSEQYVKSSNYKTQYHYYRYANSKHAGYGAATQLYPNRYDYVLDKELTLREGTSYSYTLWDDCGDWHTVYSVAYLGENYKTQKKVSDNYATRWYYQEPVYTYSFWKWGDWSGWSDTKYTQSDEREVGTQTLYSYQRQITQEEEVQHDISEPPNVYTHDDVPFTGVLTNGETSFITDAQLNSGTYSVASGPYYKNGDKFVLVKDSLHDVTEYRYGGYTNGAYFMPCKETAEQTYGGEWTFAYTDWTETEAQVNQNAFSCDHTEHLHEGGGNIDGTTYWDEYVVNGNSYCRMEQRVVQKPVTYSDPTKYYEVNADLKDKVATVMVYKKTNTDPTEEQLEYVNQIEIGAGNSYSFMINTKEKLDYEQTSDYIVSVAVEGWTHPVNVDVIKAEAPKYTVTFYNDDGTVLKDKDGIDAVYETPVGGGIDVNALPIPEKEGYRFVRWNKSLVNITDDLDVLPVFEPIEYAIVFVDHQNETAELRMLPYGEAIEVPTPEPVEGMVFRGWDNQSYGYLPESACEEGNFAVVDGPYYRKADGSYIPVEQYTTEALADDTRYCRIQRGEAPTVRGNEIITALWEPLTYTVSFCDLDGSEIASQQVAYGAAAFPPECVTKDGVTYPWDTTGLTWWNVRSDMIIAPYRYTPNTVVAPTSDTVTGEYDSVQVVELQSQDDTPIYYSTNMEITNDLAEKYVNWYASDNGIALMEARSEELGEIYDSDADEEGLPLSEIINEYTEPIVITSSTVIYAFAVKDGEISPISVYNYVIHEPGFVDPTEYPLDPDIPQITLPETAAQPGETVEVPVTIKNNPGLTNLSIVLGYDADNLTLEKAENGDVFRTSEFSADTRADGSCKFTWLTNTVNSTDGTLLTLTFKAGENAGKQKLEIMVEEAVSPDEDESPFATRDGVIQNAGSGALPGDANGDGVVNFADAILALRYDIGFMDLSIPQQKITDVNGDGAVDFADAIRILRYDAGLIRSLG